MGSVARRAGAELALPSTPLPCLSFCHSTRPFHEACEQRLLDRVSITVLPNSPRPRPSGKIFVSRCRFAPFISTTTLYAPFAGTQTADAIVGDTTFPLANNTKCYNPQNESNIVINPTNANNVVTSANEYRIDGDEVYVSMDGGKTFADVVLPGRTGATGGQGVFARVGSCGDPVLAFGPDGTLYYVGLNCNFRKGSTASGVAVSASHDGGMTWGAPKMVHFTDPNQLFNDKDWITVGPDGTVYVTWTRF